MDFFLVKTEENFINLKSGWDNIINKKSTIFQCWDFNYNWYKIHSDEVRELYIICYGSINVPKFILPCYLNSNGRLKLLQSGSCDFLDAVYFNDIDFNSLIKKSFELIDLEFKIKIVDFINIPNHSPIINYSPFVLNKKKYLIFQNTIYTCIPNWLFEENKLHKLIPSKKNGKLNKIVKQYNLETKIINGECEFPLDEINKLIKLMEIGGIREEFSFEKTFDYFKKLFSLNHIYFILQYYNNNVVSASCLVNINSNELLIWNDYFDPNHKEININKYLWLIKFCKKNQLTINFGTGVYPYKISNFVPINHSLYSLIYTKSNYQYTKLIIKKLIGKLLKMI